MSRDFKIYHRYLALSQKVSKVVVNTTETTGSGDFIGLDSTTPINVDYQITEKPKENIESIFKNKYPLQYITVRAKFERKLKKLLKENEEDDLLII